jgi:hypothetical protein
MASIRRSTCGERKIFSCLCPVGAAVCGILILLYGAAGALLVLGAGLCVVSVAVMLNPHVRHAPPIEKL